MRHRLRTRIFRRRRENWVGGEVGEDEFFNKIPDGGQLVYGGSGFTDGRHWSIFVGRINAYYMEPRKDLYGEYIWHFTTVAALHFGIGVLFGHMRRWK